MNDTDLFQSLNKIVDKKLLNDLKGSVVLQNGNTICMFEKYLLKNVRGGCVLTRLTDDLTIDFSSTKYAATWATFDNKSNVSYCERILFLDKLIIGLVFDQTLYEKYSKKAGSKDKQLTYHIKLFETKLKKRQLLNELEDFSNRAKRFQLSQFEQSSYK